MHFHDRSRFNRLPRGIALAVLLAVLLVIPAAPVFARRSDAHSDANAARYDMMFGTPDRYGAAPQDNIPRVRFEQVGLRWQYCPYYSGAVALTSLPWRKWNLPSV